MWLQPSPRKVAPVSPFLLASTSPYPLRAELSTTQFVSFMSSSALLYVAFCYIFSRNAFPVSDHQLWDGWILLVFIPTSGYSPDFHALHLFSGCIPSAVFLVAACWSTPVNAEADSVCPK